jgi:uncharacterized protein YbjT (DUF2867 family)
MKKTAIILGASGLTGHSLLQKLIEDERYEKIKLFSRSKIEGLPSKVSQHIGDLLKFEQFKSEFTADEVYCCIGTTKSKTPDKTLYKEIDYGIPVAAAKLSKTNNIPTFLVISAMGANKNSSVFYNKTKGEMEQKILQQNLQNTFVLRPSLIGGNRNEKRTLEKIALRLFKVIQPLFIGKLKAYKIVNAETIAQAMIHLANTKNHSEVIITSDDINILGNNN